MSTMKTKMITKWTGGALLGTGLEIGLGTIGTAVSSRQEGDSIVSTAGKVGMDFLISGVLGFKGSLFYTAATTGYEMILGTAKQNAELQKQMKNVGSGRVGSGYFNMSGAGYTMRQRAMNQIRSNGQNLNFVLGNEARNYLKSSRDYT